MNKLSRYKNYWPFIPILLLPVILFLPLLLTGKALYWGTPYTQFMPWRDLAVSSLKEGVIPLWNPFNGMGAPLLANYQVALFYPTTWFLLALDALGGVAWMAWGQTLVVIFHLAWAGIGMVLLARKLRLNPLAQAITGVALALSSYLVARAGFLSINAAVAWLPWIIFGGTRVIEAYFDPHQSRKTRSLSLLFLATCLALQLLAGHAQTTYYALIFLFLWMAFGGVRANKGKGLLSSIGLFALSVLIAGLFSAVQLIPTAEYLIQSQRASAVDYATAMNYSFFPLRLVTLIFTDLLGNPARGGYLLKADNYWEDAIYIGLLPLLLAIYWSIHSIFGKKKPADKSDASIYAKSKSLTLFLLVICLATFVWALGKNTPVFPFLYKTIPTIDMFQAPTRITLLMDFCLILLAGLGIDRWKSPQGKAREWTRRGIALCVAILIGSIAGLIVLKGVQATFIRSFAISGALGLGIGLLSLWKPEASGSKKVLWSILVVALVGIDLLQCDWGINPGIAATVYQNAAEQSTQSSNAGRIYLDAKSQDDLMYSQFFQFNDFSAPLDEKKLVDSLLPDSNLFSKTSFVNNYDPMVPGRYTNWMDALEKAGEETKAQMLALMDVSSIETASKDSNPNIKFTAASHAFQARWAACAISANADTALQKTIDLLSQEDLSGESIRSIVVEGLPANISSQCGPSTNPSTIVISTENTNQVKITIDTEKAGWLLLANTWYPGWKATLDGQPTDLYRSDYLFMAMQVPAGRHVLVVQYQPLSFAMGAVISLLSILIGIAILIFLKKNKLEKLAKKPNPL